VSDEVLEGFSGDSLGFFVLLSLALLDGDLELFVLSHIDILYFFHLGDFTSHSSRSGHEDISRLRGRDDLSIRLRNYEVDLLITSESDSVGHFEVSLVLNNDMVAIEILVLDRTSLNSTGGSKFLDLGIEVVEGKRSLYSLYSGVGTLEGKFYIEASELSHVSLLVKHLSVFDSCFYLNLKL
jgi:hypothetical protein